MPEEEMGTDIWVRNSLQRSCKENPPRGTTSDATSSKIRKYPFKPFHTNNPDKTGRGYFFSVHFNSNRT